MENTTDLNDIVSMIRRKELLLPDFQRGFVWTTEKQKGLVASVLARMPLGSILTLEAERNDYGCRILGRKDDLSQKEEGEKEEKVYVLLDGQQRLTSLVNVFSNMVYYDYENPGVLICNYKRLLSPSLANRFFLVIPAVSEMKEGEDLFGLKELKMKPDNPEKDIPEFLSETIKKYIEIEPVIPNIKEPYAPHSPEPGKITHYCIREDSYWIPLYLLAEEDDENGDNERRLYDILNDIVQETVKHYIRTEYREIKNEEEEVRYIQKRVPRDHLKEVLEAEERENAFKAAWEEQGRYQWGRRMAAYLKTCVTKMEMNQIVVDKSKRERAIDIYENLNLGGVTLSTFELVLAKAAKKKFADGRNLFEQIVDIIQMPKEYPAALLTETTEKYFKEWKEKEQDYSALEQAGCYDEKKNMLSRTFTEAFLNVLVLLSNIPDYDPEKLEQSILKREAALRLNEHQICANYERACAGIDRACFFLRARCGIREISSLNYRLMLVLLGYILAEDEYCKDKRLVNQLEVWYWMGIFSGRYNKDQSENIIKDIRHFLECIREEHPDYKWIQEWQKTFFAMPGFSDSETLLLKDSAVPKKVIRETICQFFVAQTYRDMMTDAMIHPFYIGKDSLQEHHIIPIGSMTELYKTCAAKERNNTRSMFNSPVNFAVITAESNRKIASRSLEDYRKNADVTSLKALDILENSTADNQEEAEEILKMRLEHIKSDITKRIENISCWEG